MLFRSLYVALTRAETGLMVSAPAPDVRASKGTIAELLHQSILSDDTLRPQWDNDTATWRSGVWQPRRAEAKQDAGAVQLTEYRTAQWRDKLVIRRSDTALLGAVRDKLDYGIHMHAILSRMQYSDELETMLALVVYEGLITVEEKEPLAVQLMELFNHPQMSRWFSREWNVRTEVSILLPDGNESRIDRLMTSGSKAVVVDFKTGNRKKADEKQVLEYMDTLRRMNFTDVEGYLLYLTGNSVVEVKPEGKPKLVKKKKDTQQLELGL